MPMPQEESLDRWELEWAPRLRGVSLAAEADADREDAYRAARALGAYYRQAFEWEPDGLAKRWPACIVTAVTAVAINGYRGSFWPAFNDAFDVADDQHTHSFWGDAFRIALRRLGLETFSGVVAHRHVGPILMHAGVPLFCFDDLLQLLAERVRLDPDLDADTFLSWAADQPQRIHRLDVPARRFLTYGTDFALDFVDRCLEMVGVLSEPDGDISRVALPSRFIERAVELAAGGELAEQPRRTHSRSARPQRPRVSLDPWGGGVALGLPSVGDAPGGAATWEVIQDGIATTVTSKAPWVGVAEAAPGVKIRIQKPVRSLVASLVGAPREYEIQLVNADTPWLIFDDAGRLIPSHAALPRDAAWILYPGTHTIESDGTLRVIEEGQVPGGWAGWILERTALDGSSWIQLAAIPGSRRTIRGFSQPRIEVGQPVNGIDSLYGSRVLTTLPQVTLPSRDDAETDWRITVRAAATGEIIAERTVSVSTETTITDLLDDLPRPVLGAFSIGVGGPLGFGVDRTLFIAEGLRAEFMPPVRALTWDGLTAATASVVGPVGAVGEPARLTFSATETATLIEYRTDTESEPLRVRPPHLRVSYETAGRLPSWQPRPVSLIAEDRREENGVLAVHLPDNGGPAMARLVEGGEVIQELTLQRRGKDEVCYLPLQQMVDTIVLHPYAEIVVLCGNLAMPVAKIRPRTLAIGIGFEDHQLVLQDPAPVPQLTATVYLSRAPWRSPVTLRVDDGRADLPAAFRGAGPLLVTLSVPASEWVTVEEPRWPERYLLAGGEGHLTDGPADEVALSRYLAGEGPAPATVSDAAWLWTVIDLADELVAKDRVDALRRDCGRLLTADAAHALTVLATLGLDRDRVTTA
ncbi:hypothetical protein AB0M20_32830, partial [Actinoplanes sp. NPDC051633]|uniref:hypothetical protein n=1 Tax=Actinoplanes sp. NPDC051633 TaxID=3155670 RepID=UPI00343356AB